MKRGSADELTNQNVNLEFVNDDFTWNMKENPKVEFWNLKSSIDFHDFHLTKRYLVNPI